MGKPLSKKSAERRKRSRSGATTESRPSRKRKGSSSTVQDVKSKQSEQCHHCVKSLVHEDRALLVEEEVGRVFCSEECIAAYFGPDIERLEKEYFRNLSPEDLSGEQREKFSHLRWITLEDPDEVWLERTLAGDNRYTLISEFSPADEAIWCICICLFLRGEPSFLFLAFTTRDPSLVDHYRRGERTQWMRPRKEANPKQLETTPVETSSGENEQLIDGLADEWTEDETLRAQLYQRRRSDDIPSEEFGLYQGCMDQTLEEPDEVWSVTLSDEDSKKIYHFIRHYPEEGSGIWFLIVARETDDEEQIEILDAFPTRDSDLVDRYRSGTQEVGSQTASAPSRLVH